MLLILCRASMFPYVKWIFWAPEVETHWKQKQIRTHWLDIENMKSNSLNGDSRFCPSCISWALVIMYICIPYCISIIQYFAWLILEQGVSREVQSVDKMRTELHCLITTITVEKHKRQAVLLGVCPNPILYGRQFPSCMLANMMLRWLTAQAGHMFCLKAHMPHWSGPVLKLFHAPTKTRNNLNLAYRSLVICSSLVMIWIDSRTKILLARSSSSFVLIIQFLLNLEPQD